MNTRVQQIYTEPCSRFRLNKDGSFDATYCYSEYEMTPLGKWFRKYGDNERVFVRADCVPHAVIVALESLKNPKEKRRRGPQLIRRVSGISG